MAAELLRDRTLGQAGLEGGADCGMDSGGKVLGLAVAAGMAPQGLALIPGISPAPPCKAWELLRGWVTPFCFLALVGSFVGEETLGYNPWKFHVLCVPYEKFLDKALPGLLLGHLISQVSGTDISTSAILLKSDIM